MCSFIRLYVYKNALSSMFGAGVNNPGGWHNSSLSITMLATKRCRLFDCLHFFRGAHFCMSRPQFAFLIEKLSTRAEVVHLIAKWRITVFFSNSFGLIYLTIYPPSIITANLRPPSASTDFFNFSETRACSFAHPWMSLDILMFGTFIN